VMMKQAERTIRENNFMRDHSESVSSTGVSTY